MQNRGHGSIYNKKKKICPFIYIKNILTDTEEKSNSTYFWEKKDSKAPGSFVPSSLIWTPKWKLRGCF